jgi:hypothetical protein
VSIGGEVRAKEAGHGFNEAFVKPLGNRNKVRQPHSSPTTKSTAFVFRGRIHNPFCAETHHNGWWGCIRGLLGVYTSTASAHRAARERDGIHCVPPKT